MQLQIWRFIPRGWRNKEVVLKKMTIFVEKIKMIT